MTLLSAQREPPVEGEHRTGTGYGRAAVDAGGWKPVSSARRVSVSTSWNRWPPMIQVSAA